MGGRGPLFIAYLVPRGGGEEINLFLGESVTKNRWEKNGSWSRGVPELRGSEGHVWRPRGSKIAAEFIRG